MAAAPVARGPPPVGPPARRPACPVLWAPQPFPPRSACLPPLAQPCQAPASPFLSSLPSVPTCSWLLRGLKRSGGRSSPKRPGEPGVALRVEARWTGMSGLGEVCWAGGSPQHPQALSWPFHPANPGLSSPSPQAGPDSETLRVACAFQAKPLFLGSVESCVSGLFAGESIMWVHPRR